MNPTWLNTERILDNIITDMSKQQDEYGNPCQDAKNTIGSTFCFQYDMSCSENNSVRFIILLTQQWLLSCSNSVKYFKANSFQDNHS